MSINIRRYCNCCVTPFKHEVFLHLKLQSLCCKKGKYGLIYSVFSRPVPLALSLGRLTKSGISDRILLWDERNSCSVFRLFKHLLRGLKIILIFPFKGFIHQQVVECLNKFTFDKFSSSHQAPQYVMFIILQVEMDLLIWRFLSQVQQQER